MASDKNGTDSSHWLFGLAALITALLGTGGIVGLIALHQNKADHEPEQKSPSLERPRTSSPLPQSTSEATKPFPSAPQRVDKTPYPKIPVSPSQSTSPSLSSGKCFGFRFLYEPLFIFSSQTKLNLFTGAIVITEVLQGYPAAEQGLQAGDAIVAFDERPVTDQDAATDAANAQTGGRPIDIRIFRASKYSITPSGKVTLVEPYTELVYTVPVRSCQ